MPGWPNNLMFLQTQQESCICTYRELDSQREENLKSMGGRVGKQVRNGGCKKKPTGHMTYSQAPRGVWEKKIPSCFISLSQWKKQHIPQALLSAMLPLWKCSWLFHFPSLSSQPTSKNKEHLYFKLYYCWNWLIFQWKKEEKLKKKTLRERLSTRATSALL